MHLNLFLLRPKILDYQIEFRKFIQLCEADQQPYLLRHHRCQPSFQLNTRRPNP